MSNYTLPELPYEYAALEPHLDAEILDLHYNEHHTAYVKGANEALDELGDARERDDFGAINQLEKNLAFHLSGHVLHSLFWKNMSPDGGGEPEGELGKAIDAHFGEFAAFKGQLSAAAIAVQGSGWGALSWDSLGKRLVVQQILDHQGNVGAATLPLLVVDMWEHAYYLQYRNRRADWMAGFWALVNWPDVAARLAEVRSTDARV